MRVRIKERGFGWLLCFINVFFFFIYKMGFFFRQYSGIASLACCVRNKKKIFMVMLCYADDKWVIKDLFFLTLFILIIIVLKPGPAGRPGTRTGPG